MKWQIHQMSNKLVMEELDRLKILSQRCSWILTQMTVTMMFQRMKANYHVNQRLHFTRRHLFMIQMRCWFFSKWHKKRYGPIKKALKNKIRQSMTSFAVLNKSQAELRAATQVKLFLAFVKRKTAFLDRIIERVKFTVGQCFLIRDRVRFVIKRTKARLQRQAEIEYMERMQLQKE